MNNGDPSAELQAGVFAHVAAEFSEDGKKIADWMLADSKCNVQLGTFTDPTITVVDLMIKGAIGEIVELCGDACTITESEFSYSSFSTKLAPLAPDSHSASPPPQLPLPCCRRVRQCHQPGTPAGRF
ncbi:hypothetical protein ISU10_18495 [Nocardioides agariphilus]|uniref:Uncharacterized protein n=1 Tax=Nocardioides agariphilus TaxID=433664 RepID=A0A930VLL1_9ACTN|nr:hypothetical protein [Nocardioides agariphilus]MBF4769764.1 hypothetical protein [Nocardioides agariphilus]